MSRNLGSHLRNPNLIVRTTGEEHHYVKPPPYLVGRIGQILVSQSRHFPSLDVQIPPPYSTYYVTRSTNSSNHFVLLDFSFPLPIRNLPPTISSRWNRARRTFPHFRRTSLSMAPRIPDVEKRDPSIPPPIIRRSSRTSSFLRTTTTWWRRSRGRCRVRHLTPPCGAGLLWQPIGLLVELIDSSTFSTSRIARQLQYFGSTESFAQERAPEKGGEREKRKKERKKGRRDTEKQANPPEPGGEGRRARSRNVAFYAAFATPRGRDSSSLATDEGCCTKSLRQPRARAQNPYSPARSWHPRSVSHPSSLSLSSLQWKSPFPLSSLVRLATRAIRPPRRSR